MSSYGYGSGGYGDGEEQHRRHGEEQHGRRHGVGKDEELQQGYGSRPEVRYGGGEEGYGSRYGDQGAYGSRPHGDQQGFDGGYGGSRPDGGYGGSRPDGGYDASRPDARPGAYGVRPEQGGYGSGLEVEQGGYGGYGREESAYGRPASEGAYGHPPPQGKAPEAYGGHESYGNTRPQKTASVELEGEAMKVFCEANPDYCLTAQDDKAVLAPADGSQHQQFFKDCKWGSRVQDESGNPAFAIVNKSCGMALKHGNNINDKVTLGPYDGETLDESFLWTQSDDVGNGYQCLRPVGNTGLNLDALHGDHTIRRGTELILFKWKKQQNQKWKIVPLGGYSRPSYGDY